MRAAQTIVNQARRMGWTAAIETAATGSVYIELTHPSLCTCDDPCEGLCSPRLIRVANHEPNEARYEYGVNAEPGLDVRPGHQAAAVEWLAEQAGIDPVTVPYIKTTTARRLRRVALQAAEELAALQDQTARQAAVDSAREALAPEHQAVLDEYDRLTGRARKNFRNTGRYRSALDAMEFSR